ncbi:dihydroxyacetone kinase subunit DhaK [Salipiger mucosus]|uniref:Putative dihydroxyacetone kinase, dihydroxyacetone binding protein subunit n=1 Tax=Salipiger mucosus DSM 16094 TaxID=1123237 RepID=S9SG58_9RHOB|nr:dihydroxyacetone kinase subunit DhaK [Salipiger mucosus]EPX85279.1 Putative dihydroxyacetone kinase, dihydroxyacetone binding protein subunit [Salipiger mucosus DSM 16094]
MPKLMNDADAYVDEVLDGLILTDARLAREGRAVTLAEGARKGVAIVSGGGSGHFPLFVGYTAPGFIDACAVGDVFAGPSVAACESAIRAADRGQGALLLYGNYGGDKMNFDMASEMVELDDIRCETVLGTDDIASGGAEEADKRRGVAGLVLLYKIAGAAADRGDDLDTVARITREAGANLRTVGIATSSCTLPGAPGPSFTLEAGKVELGMGIHGEPGLWRDDLRGADALADEMVERLLADPVAQRSGRVCLMLNSLGATPLEELLILYRRAAARLEEAGITVALPMIGHFATSMEMGGMSMSLMHLDEEREALLRAPSDCRYWRV